MKAFALLVAAVSAVAAVPETRADCLVTGCEPIESHVVHQGCARYGRIEAKKTPCPDGFVYTCCASDDGSGTKSSAYQCNGEVKCLPKDQPVDGCNPVDKKAAKKLKKKYKCAKTDVLSCCTNTDTENDIDFE